MFRLQLKTCDVSAAASTDSCLLPSILKSRDAASTARKQDMGTSLLDYSICLWLHRASQRTDSPTALHSTTQTVGRRSVHVAGCRARAGFPRLRNIIVDTMTGETEAQSTHNGWQRLNIPDRWGWCLRCSCSPQPAATQSVIDTQYRSSRSRQLAGQPNRICISVAADCGWVLSLRTRAAS